MTYRTIRTYIKEQLTKLYEPREATDIALWMLEAALKSSRAYIIAYGHLEVTDQQKQLIDQILHAHLNDHKPLAYILGTIPFLSMNLIIEPPILIPRPETEAWTAQLITDLAPLADQPLHILDLCTGSGCIGLSLAQTFPEAQVTLVDINPAAVALSERNRAQYGLTNVTIVESDLFNNLGSDQFDLIVTNPPYISQTEWHELAPNIRIWESSIALIAEDNGLALIKRIIYNASTYLKASSHVQELLGHQLYIEIGSSQAPAIQALCSQYQISAECIQDYAGHDRLIRCSRRKN